MTGPIALPSGAVDALIPAAETVAGDSRLRQKLGRATRERAMAFDIGAITDRHLDLYGSLGAGRP